MDADLEALYHTVIFPPQVPQAQDEPTEEKALQGLLLQLWKAGIEAYGQLHPSATSWLAALVKNTLRVHANGSFSATAAASVLATLSASSACILWIDACNCALLVFRPDEQNVLFEMFESAAENAQTMSTPTPLRRAFPGTAIRSVWSSWSRARWSRLAVSLASLAQEPVRQFVPQTTKAGEQNQERRDSAHPGAVTQILAAILAASGTCVKPEHTIKSVADEVCWSNAELPWRRHPLWLVLRTGLQRHLYHMLGRGKGDRAYKHIQLLALTDLCKRLGHDHHATDQARYARIKLANRMHKLDCRDGLDAAVGDKITNLLRNTQRQSVERWEAACADQGREHHVARRRGYQESDSTLCLRCSSGHLAARLQPRADATRVSVMIPAEPCPRRYHGPQLAECISALENSGDGLGLFLALADVERNVAHLHAPSTEKGALQLQQVFDLYAAKSQQLYMASNITARNADCASARLLTLALLWERLDRVAQDVMPTVAELSPGFPTHFCRHLRLPQRDQMEALHALERYMQSRSGRPSPFMDTTMRDFAERHFDQDRVMQTVHDQISVQDKTDCQKKWKEWTEKSSQVAAWRSKADAMSHDQTYDDAEERWECCDSCSRCRLDRSIREASIEIYEEILPAEPPMAKWVIFEAQCPPVFRAWRNITWQLLTDLGRPRAKSQQKIHKTLEKYDRLSTICNYSDSCLTLASTAKTFEATHYGSPKRIVGSTWDDHVYHRNGLRYFLCDSTQSTATEKDHTETPQLFFAFPGLLPRDGPYKSLQDAISNTGHTSNQVMAKMDQCPTAMSELEYETFWHLRSGERLQWLNILHALATPNLNLAALPTEWLLTQAALEAGSPDADSWLRASHQWLDNGDFCDKLCTLLEGHVTDISANWKELSHMRILLTLARRLEELSRRHREQCRRLRERIRTSAQAWTRSLGRDIFDLESYASSKELRSVRLQSALLCRATYSVHDDDDDNADTSWNAYWESAFVIASNAPADVSNAPPELAHAMLQDWTVAHAVEHLAQRSTRVRPADLDAAVRQVWETQAEFEPWRVLDAPNDRWVHTLSHAREGRQSVTVHVDIIEGTLLVNGQPQHQLPKEYRQTQSYQDLFGNRQLDVLSTTAHGMLFMAKTPAGDVYFGWDDAGILIGRADDDGCVDELIPREHFAQPAGPCDLPHALRAHQVHWLCLSGRRRGQLVIAPMSRALQPSSADDWSLAFFDRRASRRDCWLVEATSPLMEPLLLAMNGFEEPQHIVPTVDAHGQVMLALPRFGLDLHLNNQGQLEHRATGRIVARRRYCGTFVGLESALVLEDQQPGERVVLVPHGEVVVQPSSDSTHVRVSVRNSTAEMVKLATWRVRDDLGRLEGSTEPADLLLQAHLHALTSGPHADPLTGRTGTLEAVSVLAELYRQLAWPLTSEVQPLLDRLARLTPERQFYPAHLQSMQQTRWHSVLPSYAQQAVFGAWVALIVKRSNQLAHFYPYHHHQLALPKCGSLDLQKRALFREARFGIAASSLDNYASEEDGLGSRQQSVYLGRDQMSTAPPVQRVFAMADCVLSWTIPPGACASLGNVLDGAASVKGFHVPWTEHSVASLVTTRIEAVWGSLIQKCSIGTRESLQDELLFVLPFIAFEEEKSLDLLFALIAAPSARRKHGLEKLPPWQEYPQFRNCEEPCRHTLKQIIDRHDMHPEATSLRHEKYERWRDYQERVETVKAQYEEERKQQGSRFLEAVVEQWPCDVVFAPKGSFCRINKGPALAAINQHWARWWANWDLSLFLARLSDCIQETLGNDARKPRASMPGLPICTIPSLVWQPGQHRLDLLAALQQLPCDATDQYRPWSFQERPSDEPAAALQSPTVAYDSSNRVEALEELDALLAQDKWQASAVARDFVRDLQSSVQALRVRLNAQYPVLNQQSCEADSLPSVEAARDRFKSALRRLQDHVKTHARYAMLALADQEPSLRARDFFALLAPAHFNVLDAGTQEALITLALWQIEVQWRSRLHLWRHKGQTALVRHELGSQHGRHCWALGQYPGWLLLELEMEGCIRQDQADMAQSMIAPSSPGNKVFQLQMGAGKSTWIIPMVASALANGTHLVRIVVTKPLLHQAGAVLRQRLCRLAGSRLLHVPFARSSPQDAQAVGTYRALHQQARDQRGVVLALPEHLQSFQLCGIQRLLDGHDGAWDLFDFQTWLDQNARDVHDECDFIMSPKTQLIYPSGPVSLVDGGQRRWQSIARVLRRFADIAQDGSLLKQDAHVTIEEHHPKGFPFVFVQDDGAVHIRSALAQQVLSSQAFLPIYQSAVDTGLVEQCLTRPVISETQFTRLAAGFADEAVMKDLLVLRGLLEQGVLSLALSKRWNVEYGLDLNRCLVAVPYLARGQPSAASEYSHPDVAMTLTYLAYYHQGLDEQQLRRALEHLDLEEDPTAEWEAWTRRAHRLPDALSSWQAVNVRDGAQLGRLHRALAHSLPVVDYYLDRCVFPRAAREFERKLVSSSWDLPLRAPQLTTGFSGTNDNAALLPSSIAPAMLQRHQHTNAEVLWFLLQDRNDCYHCARSHQGHALTVEALLDYVADQRFHVLLDAGALILEMGNLQVAQQWLQLRPDMKGAAFVDARDVVCVVDCCARVQPLAQSPYATQMDKCLLYLDEQHCRGIDTQLVPDARAALTLGPSQPKEKTVQAAMRMRGLGSRQSVTFVAPPVVDQRIRRCCGLGLDDPVHSVHVIAWSIEESVSAILSQAGLRKAQGHSFDNRRAGIVRLLHAARGSSPRDDVALITEPEKRTLNELYGIQASRDTPADNEFATHELSQGVIAQRQAIALATQERQVDHQQEQQEKKERPPAATPHRHSLHAHIESLARTGMFPEASSPAIMPALRAVHGPASTPLHSLVCRQLWLSRDFYQTLQGRPEDMQPRPVRFVLRSSRCPESLVVVSPYEANCLAAVVSKSRSTQLLLFEAPRTRFMTGPFYHLDFFHTGARVAPAPHRLLLAELHFVAGATYFPLDALASLVETLAHFNRILDPSNARRSVTDAGRAICQLWRTWLAVRTYGSNGRSPATLVMDDKPWDSHDPMFTVQPQM